MRAEPSHRQRVLRVALAALLACWVVRRVEAAAVLAPLEADVVVTLAAADVPGPVRRGLAPGAKVYQKLEGNPALRLTRVVARPRGGDRFDLELTARGRARAGPHGAPVIGTVPYLVGAEVGLRTDRVVVRPRVVAVAPAR